MKSSTTSSRVPISKAAKHGNSGSPSGGSEVRPVAGSVVVPATEAAPADKPKRKGFFKKLLTPE
jgi:hypothetical protein